MLLFCETIKDRIISNIEPSVLGLFDIEILDDEYQVINVKTIKSQRDNEEYNREEMRFANASDKLISKIYEIKEEGIITFTNNDHINSAIIVNVSESIKKYFEN